MQTEFEPAVRPMSVNERRELTDGVFRVIVEAETAARRQKTQRLREEREASEATTSNHAS